MSRDTTTLAAALLPAGRMNEALSRAALVVLGSALLAVSSKVQVPFWPVPMTMTTAAVLLIGATFGFRLAAGSVALFLLEGLAGLPVFASGAGLVYFEGPTRGYLEGYLVAAALLGLAADRGWTKSLPLLLGAMLVADIAVFVCGYSWLANMIGAEKAWAGGVLPFLPAEALKIGLVATIVRMGWRVAPRPR